MHARPQGLEKGIRGNVSILSDWAIMSNIKPVGSS